MSTYDLGKFQEMCHCFVEFSKEYSSPSGVVVAEELEIRAFCEFVANSKPYDQLAEQLKVFVRKHIDTLQRGIAVKGTKGAGLGDIFEEDDATIELTGGAGRTYKFHLGFAAGIVLNQEKNYREGQKRKNPRDVCQFILLALSTCLVHVIDDIVDNKKVRESVSANECRTREFMSLRSPYANGISFDNTRGLVAKLAERFRPQIDKSGTVTTDQVISVVKNLDISGLANGNTMGNVVQSFATQDDQLLMDTGIGFFNQVANTIDIAKSTGNPFDQD